MWGAGNESDKPFGPAIDMMGRLSIELDGTRPFHRGEAWGGSQHNYNCWWDNAHLNHNLNMTAPFWGEFGIASLPHIETVHKYLDGEKEVWPPRRSGNFTHHTPIFGTMGEMGKLVQYSGYFMPKDSLASFILGSQLAQVVGVRHTLERARTLWPHTTGALYYKMNDNYPGVSWSCVDYYGIIKPIHYFVQKSFAPLAAVMLFDRSNLSSQEVSLPVYLLDDCQELDKKPYQVKVSIYNDQLDTVANHTFNGTGDENVVKKLGEIYLNREQTKSTMLFFVLDIVKNNRSIYRNYYFTNYEVRPGSILSMPQTTIKTERRGNAVILTNTGKYPAIGVHIEVPEKMDQLIVSENYIWLNPQESKKLKINLESPVIVKGWNLQ
jgi:beta-mannosidase